MSYYIINRRSGTQVRSHNTVGPWHLQGNCFQISRRNQYLWIMNSEGWSSLCLLDMIRVQGCRVASRMYKETLLTCLGSNPQSLNLQVRRTGLYCILLQSKFQLTVILVRILGWGYYLLQFYRSEGRPETTRGRDNSLSCSHYQSNHLLEQVFVFHNAVVLFKPLWIQTRSFIKGV